MAASTSAPKVITIPRVGTGSRVARSRIVRILVGAASADVIVDAQDTYQILSVPAGTLVLRVFARVITAFSSSVTIGIGDGDSTSGWLATAKVAPTSADTAGKYKYTELATVDAYAGGKKYLAADTIDAIIAGATPAAGLLEVLVEYADGTMGTA